MNNQMTYIGFPVVRALGGGGGGGGLVQVQWYDAVTPGWVNVSAAKPLPVAATVTIGGSVDFVGPDTVSATSATMTAVKTYTGLANTTTDFAYKRIVIHLTNNDTIDLKIRVRGSLDTTTFNVEIPGLENDLDLAGSGTLTITTETLLTDIQISAMYVGGTAPGASNLTLKALMST